MRWSPETYGADRGEKAGIGGMRDTPDGLYASPMVLGSPERAPGMVRRHGPETTAVRGG